MDGIAEIVATGESRVALATFEGQVLFYVEIDRNGGPLTIGDFDNDGFLEIASAGGTTYRVFDLDCVPPVAQQKVVNRLMFDGREYPEKANDFAMDCIFWRMSYEKKNGQVPTKVE